MRNVSIDATVYDLATTGAPLPEPVEVHGLHVIPSQVNPALAEAGMLGVPGSQLFLRQALAQVRDQYDVVLTDSPPSVGQLVIQLAKDLGATVATTPSTDRFGMLRIWAPTS